MKPDRSIPNLHPLMRPLMYELMPLLSQHTWTTPNGRTYCWALYEGYRSPELQHKLFTETHSTKVDAWHSAHQYGLAADIVPCLADNRGFPTFQGWDWNDDHPWAEMHTHAIHIGLTAPIAWDQAHIQHPVWEKIRHA